MLEAEKAHLESSLAVEVLRVRDRELTFYSECFSTIGTQSALIASIAFAILAGMSWDLKDPDGGWLHYNTSIAWGVRRDVDESELGIGSWTMWTWLEQIATLVEVSFCVACLTTQIVLIQKCALVEIGGLSLALRGPDGSAQKALHHMRLEVRRAQRMMNRGVEFLAVTIVILLVKDLPLPIAVVPAFIAATRLLEAQKAHKKLVKVLDLPLSAMQTSSPVQPETPIRRKKLSKFLQRMAEKGLSSRKQCWHFVCCDDDAQSEVLERHNSRPRCADGVEPMPLPLCLTCRERTRRLTLARACHAPSQDDGRGGAHTDCAQSGQGRSGQGAARQQEDEAGDAASWRRNQRRRQ